MSYICLFMIGLPQKNNADELVATKFERNPLFLAYSLEDLAQNKACVYFPGNLNPKLNPHSNVNANAYPNPKPDPDPDPDPETLTLTLTLTLRP